jgi:hypothetical protein|tara:strand:+ start:235 stop:501 length:267 start_codon:yes stop_codon:yes gene_type:complete
MSLEDIYHHNVNKNPINQAGISSGIPATRERDPQSIKLEQDVFAQMRSALPQPKKEDKTEPQINVQTVGLEQALKELLNGVESLDDKS